MSTDSVTRTVIDSGVVAVLRAPTAEFFAPATEILVAAGITAIEVTLTAAHAAEAIRMIVRDVPANVVVGAGTVLTGDEARSSVDAGAGFLVSPVVAPDVLEAGRDAGVPTYAGALTATEMFTASRAGAPIVKLFPASAVGPRYLTDLHGPLPGLNIMPTGGIAIVDIGTWLRAGAVAVGLGGPLLGDALSGGSLTQLRERARRAVAAVASARSGA